MNIQSKIFGSVEAPCVCRPNNDNCVCGDEEIIIRNYINGTITTPMKEEERAWCIDTACWSGEGMFDREELEKMDDRELARSVMEGWIQYADTH